MNLDQQMAANTRVTLGWAIALVGASLALIFGAGAAWGPMRTVPSDLKELQTSIRTMEITMTKLDVSFNALNETLKDARNLRSEFNTFREETRADIAKLKEERR